MGANRKVPFTADLTVKNIVYDAHIPQNGYMSNIYSRNVLAAHYELVMSFTYLYGHIMLYI